MSNAVETGPRRLLRDLETQDSPSPPESRPAGPPRSQTTGELIEEVEHERDATRLELERAQRTINALRRKLRSPESL